MLTSIEIDGKTYHARREWDDDELTPILDEDGNLIPIEVCLCYAYTPTECCCATTSWENYRYDDD